MSDTSLLDQIRAALAQIPHDATCLTMCGSRIQTIYGEWPLQCDCTRSERIAQRVTAAIAASHWCSATHCHAPDWDAALRALAPPLGDKENT